MLVICVNQARGLGRRGCLNVVAYLHAAVSYYLAGIDAYDAVLIRDCRDRM